MERTVWEGRDDLQILIMSFDLYISSIELTNPHTSDTHLHTQR